MTNLVLGTVFSMAVAASTAAVPLETSPRPSEVQQPSAGRDGTAERPAPAARPAPRPRTQDGQAEARTRAAREAARARAARTRSVRAQREAWVYVAGDPLTSTFTARAGDVVELANMSGDVTVTGGSGSEGRILAHRKAGGRNEAEARALVGQVRIEVEQHPQRVVIRALPADRANAYRIDYEITLPQGVGVDVRNASGSVSVEGVGGDVRVAAMSGDIKGQRLSRVRSMKTMSGDITIGNSTLEGEADLQTVSGDVVASSLKARALTLGSVSGNVRVDGASCERLTARTVSGDITFASPAVAGGRYEMKSHAGSINVATGARSAGFSYEAQTFKGSIRAEPGREPAGSGAGRRASGQVGDGSAYFELTSFDGDIVIDR